MSCSRPAHAYIATSSVASSPSNPSRAASITPYASVHTETASPCFRRLSPLVHSPSNSNARSRETTPLIEFLRPLPDYTPLTCLPPRFHLGIHPFFFGNLR